MIRPESTELTERIGYRFRHAEHLEEALRHSSYVNELSEPLPSNERFEFLGDAVLNLAVSHMLMERYPNLPEGDLSRMRAALVNESRLAAIARSLSLGHALLLGKGEIQTQGRRKKSILADAFEALMAAIYLDGGFEVALAVIRDHFTPLVDAVDAEVFQHDYKSLLQEWIQKHHKPLPEYLIVDENGPDHDKTFCVRLKLGDIVTDGIGKNKKAAEQDAARKAIEGLMPPSETPEPA